MTGLLLFVGVISVGAWAAPPPPGSEPTLDLSESLSLVDWLAWAASDAEVGAYLSQAREPDSLYARSLRPSDSGLSGRPSVEGRSLYAVEADLIEYDRPQSPGVPWSAPRVFLQIREAVVYTNPSQEPLAGVAFRVFPNGQDLRERGVVVQGVWVDNQPAAYALDATLMSVELPEPLAPGDQARILIHLVEDVPEFDPREPIRDSGFDPEGTGAYGRADGVFNLGYWLPLVTPVDRRGRFDIRPIRSNTEHAMFDPAMFHVVLNVPAELQVATTGVEVHRTAEGGQATVVAVASEVREFAVELVPSASILETEVEGTRIRVFHPTAEPAMGHQLMTYAEGAFRLYTERFGPIAAAELDLVEAPIRGLVGIEYPGLVTVDVSHQAVPYHRSAAHEWAVAHEIAHQWWGVEVGNDPAMEPWLDEALASHSAALYWAEVYGDDAVGARHELDVMDRLHTLHDDGTPDLPANLPAWRYELDQYAAIVFGRGSMFFDKVREQVGDDRYFSALRLYHELHRGRMVEASDLLQVLGAAADDPTTVSDLHQRWIVEGHSYEDLLGSR